MLESPLAQLICVDLRHLRIILAREARNKFAMRFDRNRQNTKVPLVSWCLGG